MRKLVPKDQRRRHLFSKYEMKRTLLQSMSRDSSLPFEVRQKCLEKIAELPRDSSSVRIRNRCFRTGRSRGFLRMFRMSRIAFRECAAAGLLPGVTKSSW